MAIAGIIAENAQGELPLTWKALDGDPSFGSSQLENRVNGVMRKLFGEVLGEAAQAALDVLVQEYAGKIVALTLINPGIDYWSKQKTQQSAGERESSAWESRARELKELRKYLIEETRELWPAIQPLLPGQRVYRAPSIPVVGDVVNAHTPDPYDFEEMFAPPTETV